MGQSQSVEEPYHRRHYNVTDKKIQRQNSLSLSSPNLLGVDHRRLQRANSIHTSSLMNGGHMTTTTTTTTAHSFSRSNGATIGAIDGDGVNHGEEYNGNNNSNNMNDTNDSAGHPTSSFMRLLPIQTEPIYFDETESEEDETDMDDEYGDDYEEDNIEDMHYLSGHQRVMPSPTTATAVRTSASAVMLDRALNVHRHDSFEFYDPREKLDQEEEQQDLSFVAPVNGNRATTFDHDHPIYYQDTDNSEQRLHPFEHGSTATNQVTIKSSFLDAIREEALDEKATAATAGASSSEDLKKKKRLSELSTFGTNRTGYDTAIPGQQGNGLSGSSNVTSTATPPAHLGFDVHSPIHGSDQIDTAAQQQKEQKDEKQEQAPRVAVQETEKNENVVAQLAISGKETGATTAKTTTTTTTTTTTMGERRLQQPMSMLSYHSSEDVDSRVNEMELLVAYKLADIESKVQDIPDDKAILALARDQAASNTFQEENEKTSSDQPLEADTDAVPTSFGEGHTPDSESTTTSTATTTTSNRTTNVLPNALQMIGNRTSIAELRFELQTLGMRYHELNDGLLTDLMAQMRDAKLVLYQTLESEQHAKMLNGIENRIQERVRAMEQISSRLEACFDKMDSRLGAIETVLTSSSSTSPSSTGSSTPMRRRPRPESMYQVLQQQYLQQVKLQQEQQQEQQKEGQEQIHRRNTIDSHNHYNSNKALYTISRVNQYNATSALFAGATSTGRHVGENMMSASPSNPSSLASSNSASGDSTSSLSSASGRPALPIRIRTNVGRPGAIDMIHSAGPVLRGARSLERASTLHNIHGGGPGSTGQSVPNTPISTSGIMAKRSLLANLASGQRTNPHVMSSGAPKPPKKVPRPESYKELLHFWKAGGSMPDLLKGVPAPTTSTTSTTAGRSTSTKTSTSTNAGTGVNASSGTNTTTTTTTATATTTTVTAVSK
ncbi:hypothetical protein BGZ94_006308 [Podila epigama]|nr:hypothetical protein BGZ94_006308 [Podila epigama]